MNQFPSELLPVLFGVLESLAAKYAPLLAPYYDRLTPTQKVVGVLVVQAAYAVGMAAYYGIQSGGLTWPVVGKALYDGLLAFLASQGTHVATRKL